MRALVVLSAAWFACSPPSVREPAAFEQVRALDADRRAWLRRAPRVATGLPPAAELQLAGRVDDPSFPLGELHRPWEQVALGEPEPTAPYTNPIRFATVDQEGGQALREYMEQFSPSQVAEYGVSIVPGDVLWGTDEEGAGGICDQPTVDFPFGVDGQPYEGRVWVQTYADFVGDVLEVYATVPARCRRGLKAAEGDVQRAIAAGDCADDDLLGHAPEGSECLACIQEQAGDFDACVAQDRCPREAPDWVWVQEGATPEERGYYQMLTTSIWACAPDWTLNVFLLVTPPEGGGTPLSWDHEAWAYICMPVWDETTGQPEFFCLPGQGGPKAGDTVGRGIWGVADYLRPERDGGEAWAGRSVYVDRIELKSGVEVAWSLATVPGNGAVSLPEYPEDYQEDPDDVEAWGSAIGWGWGQNPRALRPDGQDRARDFLAALAMKTATQINGVVVEYHNASRCAEEDWVDLGNDQSYCQQVGPPREGWGASPTAYRDGGVWSALPMYTLASTGRPDPEVPGGFATYLAGSEWLERIDGCTYPNTFVPDLAPYPDDPADPAGASSLVGHTYRFGKDDDGIVGVMAANRPRLFCSRGE
jgi:hypothetical protein